MTYERGLEDSLYKIMIIFEKKWGIWKHEHSVEVWKNWTLVEIDLMEWILCAWLSGKIA